MATDVPDATDLWRHDLKNQIGIVIGFTELLLEDMSPTDPRRSDIDEIHKAARRAMELLNRPALEDPRRS